MGRRQADYVLKRQYSDISPTNTGFILTIIRHSFDRPGGPAVLLPLVALVINTQLVSSGWSIHTYRSNSTWYGTLSLKKALSMTYF